MAVTAEDVKRLREETGAGVMDAKRALDDAGGNFAQAKEILREKGGWMAEKLYEYLQQQEENAIARMGLANERRGIKNDRQDDLSDTAAVLEAILA